MISDKFISNRQNNTHVHFLLLIITYRYFQHNYIYVHVYILLQQTTDKNVDTLNYKKCI